MRSRRVLLAVMLCATTSACGNSTTGPSAAGTVTIGAPSPAAGSGASALLVASGGLLLPGSGQVQIPITVTSSREVPWAQLYVYLLTADGYCGQNLPDAPTWGPFPKGRALSVTIGGFQVFRNCEVTGVRAMLHVRNNGLLTPPTASETIAEATRAVNWTILR